MAPLAIADAPLSPRGYWEARPGDVIGRELSIVDVRYEEDLLGADGHIHGVRHAPAASVEAHGLPGFDPSAPVVIVCGNGRQSARVATALTREHGFAEVYLLVGGMIRWLAEERPIARRRTYASLSFSPASP